jgi:hypothetical protein
VYETLSVLLEEPRGEAQSDDLGRDKNLSSLVVYVLKQHLVPIDITKICTRVPISSFSYDFMGAGLILGTSTHEKLYVAHKT